MISSIKKQQRQTIRSIESVLAYLLAISKQNANFESRNVLTSTEIGHSQRCPGGSKHLSGEGFRCKVRYQKSRRVSPFPQSHFPKKCCCVQRNITNSLGICLFRENGFSNGGITRKLARVSKFSVLGNCKNFSGYYKFW